MRFHGIVLPVLAVAVLFSSADGRPTDIAKMETPNMPAMAHSFTGTQYAQRMLRTADDDEEERGFTDKISGIFENVAMKSELKSLLKKRTTADDMLDKLKLNTGVVNILENPTFKRLDDYISMYKHEFPHSGVTMVGTLTARYGDDAVARALEAGKRSIATEDMAKRLQGEQFRLWLDEGKSPVHIFKLLKLNDKTTRPLTGDTVGAWRSYLDVFHKRKPDDALDEFTVFRQVYGDRGFANLLFAANWDDKAREAANVLQHRQFMLWSRNHVPPEEVLTTVFKLKTSTLATSADNMIVDKYRTWLNTNVRQRRTHS